MVRAALVVAFAFTLTGCAGTVSSMIRASDKDPSFSFDGNYTFSVDYPASRQTLGPGWFANCRAEKSTGAINVVASEVFWPLLGDAVASGFIDSDGRFRVEQPLETEAKGSREVLSDGSATAILQGDISDDTMKGLLVYGLAQFNGRGCSYPVTYSKV